MSSRAQLEAATGELERLRGAVRDARQRREVLFEHMLAGWWTLDARGRVTLSPGFRARLELAADAPAPPEVVSALQAGVAGRDAPVFEVELRLPTAAEELPIRTRVEVIARAADGRPKRWRGGNLDLRRLIAAQEETSARLARKAEDLARLNLQLAARAEQLERSNTALEDFAYAASHDLQAPLRAIAHFAAWIDEDLPPESGEEVREHVARLLDRVDRLSQLHADLLAYARVAHTAVDWRAGEPMRAVYDSWARVGDSRIHLTAKGSRRACLLPVDQLAAILDQLLSNTVRHHDRPHGAVEVRISREADWLQFEVEDDGPGIEPRFAEQAFKVLETLRPRDAGAGSGVGLPIARKHARRAGGEVSLVEREGRGALFLLRLPYRELPA